MHYNENIRSISNDLLEAGVLGARLSLHLSKMASDQGMKIDASMPMESQDEMQAVSALTRLSSEASQAGQTVMKLAESIKNSLDSEKKSHSSQSSAGFFGTGI